MTYNLCGARNMVRFLIGMVAASRVFSLEGWGGRDCSGRTVLLHSTLGNATLGGDDDEMA